VPPLTKAINYHAKIDGFNGLYNGTPADFGQHTSTTTVLEDLTNLNAESMFRIQS
jgi:hypothetical protein